MNLESQSNFGTSRLFVDMQRAQRANPGSYREYNLKIQDSLSLIRHSGTAIFLIHNKKHYLITARHVLEDTASYFKPQIYWNIFLRPNGSDLFDGKPIEPDTAFANYIQLTASTTKGETPFIFSDTILDLAIISLNDIKVYGPQFIRTLFRKGYLPISASDIDTIGNIRKNDHLTSLGFPDFSEVAHKNIPRDYQNWQSWAITIPAVTRGFIEEINTNFIYGNIFIYKGFSGGPNKLIGINHAYTRVIKKMDEVLMNKYIIEYSIFSRVNSLMPMLRELERRLKLK